MQLSRTRPTPETRAVHVHFRLGLILSLVGSVACQSERGIQGREPVLIAAASDLTVAFAELGPTFESQTGQRATFSFGSTGLLAHQIAEGAPFDLFAAANTSFVKNVVDSGACDGATQAPYGRGRIVLWTRAGAVPLPSTPNELSDARFRRIAIAQPEHAPYGRAAREALEDWGIWDSVSPRLVYGENVSQTLQLAQSGNVEVAIVALSLVVGDRANPWSLVEERHHRPIEQALVVCQRGRNRAGAEAFAALLSSKEGREIMRRHGFVLPGEVGPISP